MSPIRAGAEPDRSARQRADLWLYRARWYKSREKAAAAIEAGAVRAGRAEGVARLAKPSQTIKAGDVLSLARADGAVAFEILALLPRRGPAVEARSAYRLLAAATSFGD